MPPHKDAVQAAETSRPLVSMPTGGLLVIPEAECRTLLASTDLGRIVISLEALPVAFPVNFRIIDDAIVFRTGSGTKLRAAVDNRVVGFQVDRVDRDGASGWSVLVHGTASVVSDPDRIAALDRHDIRSLSPEPLLFYVRISIDRVSGRRIAPCAE
jgi:nitroimidazol reductase NimA-like FMN-containing flavoprotein (pyridoxamine 5'-phosphate oxidase superfamily)